ncbi:MAG: MetQ/NlpA family ABC transporter substrate-binding protein [Clostridia bacterium]|nr:MetQ/NlpA family ABC transporter substrate-binding protein [Clostridia bacterium]
MKKLFALALALVLIAVPAFSSLAETIKLGVTGAFYEDLWQPAIDALAKEGIDVELVQFSDFSLPNNALNGGEIQMNAFQHHAYFNNDTTTNGYDLTVIADTFVITMNLYSSKYDTIEDLQADVKAGKALNIVIPNDATNQGRALLVLKDAGVIGLTDDYESTPNTENVVALEGSNVTLTPVNAAQTYQFLEDADAAIINGNYAASYGVDPTSGIFNENVNLDDERFICLIAVRTADADNETYKRVAEVFCSDVTSEVANTTFNGFFKLIWEKDAE